MITYFIKKIYDISMDMIYKKIFILIIIMYHYDICHTSYVWYDTRRIFFTLVWHIIYFSSYMHILYDTKAPSFLYEYLYLYYCYFNIYIIAIATISIIDNIIIRCTTRHYWKNWTNIIYLIVHNWWKRCKRHCFKNT